MKTGMIATLAGLAVAGSASAGFVSFVVTSTALNHTGAGAQGSFTAYTLFARFDGATDTVLNAFNLGGVGGSSMNGFYHKDLASYNSNVLMSEFGTWNPSQTGAIANRAYDSYLVIGGLPSGTNTTNADPSWVSGGNADARSWARPDLPTNGTLGWFNSNPPNNQGRVGGAGNTATDVRLGQFVLAAGDSAPRTYTLTLGYNNGVQGSAVQFATGTFSLPTPGAIALLGLAGLAGRRRR